MSLGADERQVNRSKPALRAGAGRAQKLIEVLEPRQFLSAQCLEAAGHASATQVSHASIIFQVAVQGQPARPVLIEASSAGAGDTPAIPAVTVRSSSEPLIVPAVQDLEAADASDPVQRLGSGSHFSGYNYIPPDGSAPPPVVVVVDVNGVILTQVSSGGSAVATFPPKKIKPSDRGLPQSDDSGPALTPLAQTPPARAASTLISVRREGLPVPAPIIVAAPIGSAASPVVAAMSHSGIYLGTVAMAEPAEVVLTASPAVAGVAVNGLASASNKAADALALIASPEDLAVAATYNFVHFNPSVLLNDAIAAFSQESASLSFVPLPTHSTARAWSITVAVVGLDLLLLGYCYQKSRRQRLVAATLAENPLACA
jgi:hypothetical protein